MKKPILDANNYIFPDYSIIAINKFIDAGIKTNIHFVVTSESFEDACNIIKGIDIWGNKFDISKLNAVIFLLFKPQGCGIDKKYLCLDKNQIEEFSTLILSPKCKFKIGCDSCMINKISQVRELTENEKISVDTCEAARMSCYISPDMYYMPCSFGNKKDFGTLITKENTIKNIWDNGSSFKMFRNILEKEPKSCPYEL